MPRRTLPIAGIFLAAIVAYAVLPLDEQGRNHAYDAIATTTVVIGWVTFVVRRPAHRAAWSRLLIGYTLWVLGDWTWGIERYVLQTETFPGIADAFYLAAYVLLAAGAETLVRAHLRSNDRAFVLDAAIVAAGVAVPAAVFLIVPAATDSSLTVLGKLVSSAYPVGDTLVLAVLVRLVVVGARRSVPVMAVMASLVACLVADVWWNAAIIVDPSATVRATEVLWLCGYALLVLGLLHPSVTRDVNRRSHHDSLSSGRRRLGVLTLGSLLPAATLLLAGLSGAPVPWLAVSVGGAILSLLVVVQMAGLLEQVRRQARQLETLARRDELTGAPNRRTWDAEIERATLRAAADRLPLCVAMLDLDNFKDFNDRHGHPAGDQLLRRCVGAWEKALDGAGVLARYGGEEFAVLLPGADLAAATAVVDRLRRATPDGQTVSAGVASWEPGTPATFTVEAADAALYAAKRSGRDRVVAADALSPGRSVAEEPAALASLPQR